MGLISHTGQKTSRAARDRPEPKPRRNRTSRHDIAGGSPERRPPLPIEITHGAKGRARGRDKAALICANVRHHMARIGRPATSHLPQACAHRRATISRGAAHSGATIRPSRSKHRRATLAIARSKMLHQRAPSAAIVSRRPAAQLHASADQFAQQVREVGLRVRNACARSGALPCAASAQVARLTGASVGAPPHMAAAGVCFKI
ncbi:DNA (cytosine-5)-methyltransferase CMT3-like [Dorcoceras hygrometricum]|uniref:DNA (Cytosine-5)-methyltransferase CMT3-like n=1 Tax=Dorcoceras hygrometricum TaxID=472368 RepID=A0A2Z7AEE9_9LAMI|nr:DNA (cytosine-5)-methyltransferase CMT3-like [Dorcoceras hygrometricum]